MKSNLQIKLNRINRLDTFLLSSILLLNDLSQLKYNNSTARSVRFGALNYRSAYKYQLFNNWVYVEHFHRTLIGGNSLKLRNWQHDVIKHTKLANNGLVEPSVRFLRLGCYVFRKLPVRGHTILSVKSSPAFSKFMLFFAYAVLLRAKKISRGAVLTKKLSFEVLYYKRKALINEQQKKTPLILSSQFGSKLIDLTTGYVFFNNSLLPLILLKNAYPYTLFLFGIAGISNHFNWRFPFFYCEIRLPTVPKFFFFNFKNRIFGRVGVDTASVWVAPNFYAITKTNQLVLLLLLQTFCLRNLVKFLLTKYGSQHKPKKSILGLSKCGLTKERRILKEEDFFIFDTGNPPLTRRPYFERLNFFFTGRALLDIYNSSKLPLTIFSNANLRSKPQLLTHILELLVLEQQMLLKKKSSIVNNMSQRNLSLLENNYYNYNNCHKPWLMFIIVVWAQIFYTFGKFLRVNNLSSEFIAFFNTIRRVSGLHYLTFFSLNLRLFFVFRGTWINFYFTFFIKLVKYFLGSNIILSLITAFNTLLKFSIFLFILLCICFLLKPFVVDLFYLLVISYSIPVILHLDSYKTAVNSSKFPIVQLKKLLSNGSMLSFIVRGIIKLTFCLRLILFKGVTKFVSWILVFLAVVLNNSVFSNFKVVILYSVRIIMQLLFLFWKNCPIFLLYPHYIVFAHRKNNLYVINALAMFNLTYFFGAAWIRVIRRTACQTLLRRSALTLINIMWLSIELFRVFYGQFAWWSSYKYTLLREWHRKNFNDYTPALTFFSKKLLKIDEIFPVSRILDFFYKRKVISLGFYFNLTKFFLCGLTVSVKKKVKYSSALMLAYVNQIYTDGLVAPLYFFGASRPPSKVFTKNKQSRYFFLRYRWSLVAAVCLTTVAVTVLVSINTVLPLYLWFFILSQTFFIIYKIVMFFLKNLLHFFYIITLFALFWFLNFSVFLLCCYFFLKFAYIVSVLSRYKN